MIARGRGQIGIMSLARRIHPAADAPSYCASKAAVLSYGLGLRGAVEDKGIRVSVVCPGYVDTPMIAQETGWQPFKMSAESRGRADGAGPRRQPRGDRVSEPFSPPCPGSAGSCRIGCGDSRRARSPSRCRAGLTAAAANAIAG